MEYKEAFDQLSGKLNKSLEEYNQSAGKKVMVIPKPTGESYYIFNRKTIVIRPETNHPDVAMIEYYNGQKDVIGNAFDTAAEFVEKEKLTCFIKDEAYFSFTTVADKKNMDHMVNALLKRVFSGRIQ
jgi:hypothetical protein